MDSEWWANALVAACFLGFAALGAVAFAAALLADPAENAMAWFGLGGAGLVAAAVVLGWRNYRRIRRARMIPR